MHEGQCRVYDMGVISLPLSGLSGLSDLSE